MLTKIALSAAIVLATASGVLAATKHPVHRHHGAAVQSQVQASGYDAFASATRAPGAGRLNEAGATLIQDRDYSFSGGGTNGYCSGRC